MTTVSGILRDAKGTALAGVSVTVRYVKAVVGYNGGAVVANNLLYTASETGLLTMPGLVAGPYEISIAVPVWASAAVTAAMTATMVVNGEDEQALDDALQTTIGEITPTVLSQVLAAADAVAADRAAVEDLALTRAVHIYEGAAITNPIVLPYAPANTGLVEVYLGTSGAMIRTSAFEIDADTITFTEAEFPPDLDRVEIVVWGSGTLNVSEMPVGSAATPGLPFVGDSNTGFFRPAADQVGIATGGVQRVKVTTSAMQVDVPITGAAVQSSPSDATSGKVLKVGAFGLGGIAPILPAGQDINAAPGVIAPGLWTYATSQGHTNGPSGVVNGTLRVTQRGATVASQEMLVDWPSADIGEIWIRSYVGGAWQPWRQLALVISGATALRPTIPVSGQMYFDTTRNKPIWHNGTGWVDATGATA